MSFLGFYNNGETVRFWMEFINHDGSAATTSNVKISIIKDGTSVLVNNASMVQHNTILNLYFYDYIISSSEVECTITAIAKGDIDGVTAQGADTIQVNHIKELIKELRTGNQMLSFYTSPVGIPARNVGPGVLERIEFRIKNDDAVDFSSPTSVKTLYLHYTTTGDLNPSFSGDES